jgi:hypothetical protein
MFPLTHKFPPFFHKSILCILYNHKQVYDPVTNTWTTVGTIPNEYLTSDSGAFTNGDKTKIYVVGGYNQNYFNPDSLSTTFMFDTTEINNKALVQNQNNANIADTSTTTDIIVKKMADLNNPRGDIHAVTITTSSSSTETTDTDTTDNGNGNGNGDTTKAYVAGGFTAMCQPLKVRYRYVTLRYVCIELHVQYLFCFVLLSVHIVLCCVVLCLAFATYYCFVVGICLIVCLQIWHTRTTLESNRIVCQVLFGLGWVGLGCCR